MDRARNGRVAEVLDALLATPAADRAAFLDGACAGDAGLREEVESLAAAHEVAGDFFAQPTAADSRAAPAPAEAPGAAIGRYKLLQRIGEGGFGVVYMAEQQHPIRRRVALKIIKLGMDTRQVVARFEAERQALAMMDHPNIAKVLDAGATETGRPYFVMELVRGVPITEYCDANHLSTRERLALFVPICQAVQHAHQKAIIHRDIKPNNVLVTTHDGKPVPKVIDFGIAKATDQRLTEKTLFTEHRQMIGTPAYMSPEQAEVTAADVDTRSDIYSLGVLLYELLTGTTPFDAKELRGMAYAEIQRVIREVDPPRPSTRVSTLGCALAGVAQHRRAEPRKLGQLMSGELDWIVMKAIEKDRTRRYETATGLGKDVERYLAGEAVQARPASALYKLRKFAGRNKALAGAAAAVALALLLGTAGTGVGLVRARAAQDRAQTAHGYAETALGAAEAARAQAEAARTKSEAEARTSRAVLDYTRRLLLSAQPDPKLNGLDLRVDDLLERAGKEIEATLKGQPEAEIEARVMLARMYFAVSGWGKSDKVAEHFRRAYELSRSLPDGAESERTLGLAASVALYLPSAGRHAEAKDLAPRIHEAARRKLGPSHPVTLQAAYVFGWALMLTDNRHPDTDGLMGPAFEHVVNQALDRTPPEMYSVLADYPAYLRNAGRAADAERAARRAMERVQAEPPGGAVANAGALVGQELSYILFDQNKQEEATSVAGQNLEYARRHLGAFHSNTRSALNWYVVAVQSLGRPGEAEEALGRQLNLARARFAGDDPILADALAELGQAWKDLGRREQTLHLSEEAAAMRRRLFGAADATAREWLIKAYPIALGSWRQPADGSLAAQIFCALEDIAYNNREYVPMPTEASASLVRYRLTRWGAAGTEIVGEGTLADAAEVPPLAPGLHLLSVEVPGAGSGSPPALRDYWILTADWRGSVYSINRVWNQGPPRPAADQKTLADLRVPSLAILHDLKAPPGIPAENFQLTAATRIDLPAGRYRLFTTSDDGVRLYVDGKLAIASWHNRAAAAESCELDLAAGPHELKVEYFQGSGPSALWVRVEPLAPEAEALRSISIRRELDALSPAVEAKPSDVALLTRRGSLLARAGRFEEAARDYARLVELEPKDHRHWHHRACLLAYLGKGREEETREHCRRMLRQFPVGNDPQELDRTTKSALLLPHGVGDDVHGLVGRAQAALSLLPASPWAHLLMGLAEYRAGRFAAAADWLQMSRADEPHPTRDAAADALLAMARHALGQPQEANAAVARSVERLQHAVVLRGGGDLAPSGLNIEDWLIAHTLCREARALIELDDRELGILVRETRETALLRDRAGVLARTGRFEEAAEQYARLIERQPEEHWHWYYRACLLAYLNKGEEYREHCSRMQEQFRDAGNFPVIDRTTKSSLLLGDGAGGDVTELVRRAERARSLVSGNHGRLQPWSLQLMGMAEYRAGRLGAAVEWLEKCRTYFEDADRTAAADALLAMAHARLGRAEEARAALARCVARIEKDLVPVDGGDLTAGGVDHIEGWLMTQVLRREAEALLSGTGAATASAAGPAGGVGAGKER